MAQPGFNIAIVGATGAVGRELIRLLEDGHVPTRNLTLIASQRSSGRSLEFNGRDLPVVGLDGFGTPHIDLAFFSAGAEISTEYASCFTDVGALVIDNSSAFRLASDVPLTVPQVNPESLSDRPLSGLIANPNCSTIQLVRALAPIRQSFGIERVILATYQAASGGGLKGIEELLVGSLEILSDGEPEPPTRFPMPLAFNAIPQVGDILDDGLSVEEQKLAQESRKILGLPRLWLTATCVRIPVVNGHSEAVYVECATAVEVERVREVLVAEPGLRVYGSDKPHFPTPRYLDAADHVHIGRVRPDPDNPHAFWMWVVADNLQVGAALNAIEIAQLAIKNRIVTPA